MLCKNRMHNYDLVPAVKLVLYTAASTGEALIDILK